MRFDSPKGLYVVLAVGVAFILALIAEVPYVNGPPYWRWPFQSLSFLRALLLFAGPLALYGVLLWRWASRPSPSARDVAVILTGLVSCSILLQLASLHVDERGFEVLVEAVLSRDITSYYTDAARIGELSAWLPNFPNIRLEHHSVTHPPGPVLYYYACIQLFGERLAPLIGGCLIGVIASLGVAVIYHFAALWTEDRHARLGASFLYTLSPALIVLLPEFDQVYPLGSMAMMITWKRAIERPFSGIWLGVTLFVTSLLAYNFLTMGAPMGLLGAYELYRAADRQEAFRRIVYAAGLALAVAIACHAILWLATSFPAFDSFLRSLTMQEIFAGLMDRPWHLCIFFDLYDLLLGAGMVVLPLLVFSLRSAPHALTWIGLASILFIDLTGLLRCEAARVWLFLQPLLFVPAGLELARWNPRSRAIALGLQALIVIVLRCKLAFFLV